MHVKKKKYKIVINNKMRNDYGAMNPKTNKIEINVRAHKGDKAELASTLKHELLHVKHPKMTEKQVYKASAKTKIPPMEQHKLIAKLKNKSRNYKVGALKRKYKLGPDTKPGDFISQVNSQKAERGVTEKKDKTQTAIRGMI